MIRNKGSEREALRRLGQVDPLDWLMGGDWGELQIGAKHGVAPEVFLLRRMETFGGGRSSGGGVGGSAGLSLLTKSGASGDGAVRGGGNQAVVKLIRNGGTQSARGLKAQLTYLNREGTEEVRRSERYFGSILSNDEQDSLVEAWGLDKPNKTGVEKTTHFVVSYPPGTDRIAAEQAGRAWADQLFNSGDYGDIYDYYTVAHNDTDHPHTHVVVNRRGIENGSWLKLSKRSVINYNVLRDIQVEVSRDYDIHLDASPRFARGEVQRPITDPEIRRAERELREPEPRAHNVGSAALAGFGVSYFADRFEKESLAYSSVDTALSSSLQGLADGLRGGLKIQEILKSVRVIDVQEGKQLADRLAGHRREVIDGFREIDKRLAELPEDSPERAQFERKTGDERAEIAPILLEGPGAEGFSAVRDPQGRYRGVSANDDIGRTIKEDADKRVREIAKAAGLNPDVTVQRYNGSEPIIQQQANAWEAQERRQLRAAGRDPASLVKTNEQISSVYAQARERLHILDDTRSIIRADARGEGLDHPQDVRKLNEQRLSRVRSVLTLSQREQLERGDVNALRSISERPSEQRAIATNYLKAAVQEQNSPDRSEQLQRAQQLVAAQEQRAQKAAQQALEQQEQERLQRQRDLNRNRGWRR